MEILQDILAAIGVILNGLPQGLLAISYGFASVPTALGFAVGAAACGILGSAAPISFQAETIVMAGTMGKNRRERLSMVMFGGLLMAVLGLTGALSAITDFAGEAIVHAMMAGVGFVLAKTAFDMVKENPLVGWTSMASAVAIYLISKVFDPANALVYTIVGSLIVSSIVPKIAKKEIESNAEPEKMCRLKLEKPTVNLSVIRGALSLACLTIGANIAFGNITGSMGQRRSKYRPSDGLFRSCGCSELSVRWRPGGSNYLCNRCCTACSVVRCDYDGCDGLDSVFRITA